jgi:hypothetical protein
MSPDDGRTDHRILVVRIVRQGPENALPNAALRPPAETPVDLHAIAEALRDVAAHGAPVRSFQITASRNSRLSFARDQTATALKEQGWCVGETGQVVIRFRWHRC